MNMACLLMERRSLGLLMQTLQKCRPISSSSSSLIHVTHVENNHALYRCNLPFQESRLHHILLSNMKNQKMIVSACSLHMSLGRQYSNKHGMTKQSDNTMPKHHTDKLQLSFEDEDLAQLLDDAKHLLNTDSFKQAGVKGKEAESVIENLVKYLCLCQCSPDNVLHTIESNPDILNTPWGNLQKIIMILEEIGLRRGQLLKALNAHKALWDMEEAAIRKRLGQLRHLGFNQDLQKVVAKWPQILTVSSKKMSNVVEALEQCDFSRGEISVIVEDHPQVLSDAPEDINIKFQYVHFCMGITEGKELVYGKIFRYNLDHIRARHILLDRMGIYRTPDKHKIDSAKNPQLQMIIDSTDKRFCSKVATGISVEDFEIFKRNLKDELKEMGVDDDDGSGYLSDEYDSSVEESDEDDTDDEYSDSEEDEPKTKYQQ